MWKYLGIMQYMFINDILLHFVNYYLKEINYFLFSYLEYVITTVL